MTADTEPGRIVILNGVPRAGKSSIAAAMQERGAGPWMNLGVDVVSRHVTPPRLRPGIGLRPGGERPDLEPFVAASYAALFESIGAHARLGLNVVADLGLHDAYSRPLGILADAARRLRGLPVLLVGLRCPIDVIMERRRRGETGREGVYASADPGEPVPPPVLAWQREVHRPGLYDLELDTSVVGPEACADAILARLASEHGGPTAFTRLDGRAAPPDRRQ